MLVLVHALIQVPCELLLSLYNSKPHCPPFSAYENQHKDHLDRAKCRLNRCKVIRKFGNDRRKRGEVWINTKG